jgi:large subunit ribosomal protein L18
MSTPNSKTTQRTRRHSRIRAKVSGTAACPRLAVFRSNRFIYAQLIDDSKGTTLVAADSRTCAGEGARQKARAVGTSIAAQAAKVGITSVVFDRGGFLYTGVIKEVADGAREGGLIF